MKTFIKLLISLTIITTVFCPNGQASNPVSFNQLPILIKKALMEKNLPTLQKHIALDSIILSKIKRLSQQAGKSTGWRALLANKVLIMGEISLTKIATEITLKEFKASSRGIRQRYLQQYTVKRVGNKNDIGFVQGIFMDQPLYISAIWANDNWVIVGVESAVIDRELTNLLQIVTNQKN